MVRDATRMQLLLAQLAGAFIIIFAFAGLAIYGTSLEVWQRIFTSIAERPGGPMTFRFILQPMMAALLAAFDGVRDARSGEPPYFWSLVTGSAPRAGQLSDGVIATSRVILLGLVMDVIYQLVEFRTFYPGEAAIISVLLAFVPYLLLRGPFERLARAWGVGTHSTEKRP